MSRFSESFLLPDKTIPQGEHILVVDDTPAMANLIAGYLREAGYKVEIAHSAEEAWESLLQRLPVLMTVDDFLPGADSWELLRCVRSLKYSWEIPMIRLGDKTPNWSGLLENGPGWDMVLFKPFVPQEWIAFWRLTILGCIQRHRNACKNGLSSGQDRTEQWQREPKDLILTSHRIADILKMNTFTKKKLRSVMLAEKVILYDDSCPLCQLYTEGFVRLGVLPREGRVAFGQAPVQCPELLERLDVERGRVAIPLLDRATGEVVYGLDALFTLIGHKSPWLRPVLRLRGLKTLVGPLYRLLSYNRRQIAGCQPPTAPLDCRPAHHTGWRLAWLALALVGWSVGIAAHASTAPVLLVALLQLLGLLFVARRGWDALGSYATNGLVFVILLALSVPWPLALVITLADLRRRSWVFRAAEG